MNINASNEFSQIISFLVQVFGKVISWLDGIILIGDNTSLLDLNIALTVFGIIFVAVFNVVKSGAVNSMDSVSSSREAQRRQARKSNREVKNEN